MPSLQVRDMPEPLFLKLARAAKRDHRSLAQETIVILTEGLECEENPKKRREALLAEIRAFQPTVTTEKLKSPIELLRKDRDR